jgi:hypothetical protein
MKAIINGIEVSGTPEEILQFQQLSNEANKNRKYIGNINAITYIKQPNDIAKKIIQEMEKLDKSKTFWV